MANTFYNRSGSPATRSRGLSAPIRNEFAAISTAFDHIPRITTTGIFDTVFNQQGNYTFTLPAAPGALAMLSDITPVSSAVAGEITRATAAEALLAPLASPAFTGTPTVPTPGDTDHTLKAVNSTWVANFLAASGYAPTGASPVTSVAAKTGAVVLAHSDIADWNATLAPYLTSSSIPPVLRGYLGGLGLSVDVASPLLVLDIAAGTCTDSTNTTTITLGAFTKSIGGAWTAGSGNNAMGVGLTATALAWYHVFAAIVAGVPDVFFDTSVTAANKPASTTAFRRIGSFKLDASVHILPFTQTSDRFDRATPNSELSSASSSTTAINMTLASVPPGVVTQAILSGSGFDSVSGSDLYLSSLAQTDIVPSSTTAVTMRCPLNTTNSFSAIVATNTSQQIRRRSSTTTQTLNILTSGYIDIRGRG